MGFEHLQTHFPISIILPENLGDKLFAKQLYINHDPFSELSEVTHYITGILWFDGWHVEVRHS